MARAIRYSRIFVQKPYLARVGWVGISAVTLHQALIRLKPRGARDLEVQRLVRGVLDEVCGGITR